MGRREAKAAVGGFLGGNGRGLGRRVLSGCASGNGEVEGGCLPAFHDNALQTDPLPISIVHSDLEGPRRNAANLIIALRISLRSCLWESRRSADYPYPHSRHGAASRVGYDAFYSARPSIGDRGRRGLTRLLRARHDRQDANGDRRGSS